jgi:hypothetical protein
MATHRLKLGQAAPRLSGAGVFDSFFAKRSPYFLVFFEKEQKNFS